MIELSAALSFRPRRSALYLPASNARALEKARTLACDVVILDLEDSVAPESKPLAREQALQAVGAGGFGRREVVIRVNGLETPWGEDDLRAAVEAGPDAVLVPKIADAGDIARYDGRLSHGAERTRLWAMVETCRAVFHLDGIAGSAATSRLTCLVVGSNDLAKEMGAELAPGREPFLGPLSLTVAAARAHGLSVLDGVFNGIGDPEGFARECRQAKVFGFDGKTLIHPSQIDPCNAAFTPPADHIAWARTVAAAFADPANAGKGVLQVEGRQVERLHLAEAEKLLIIADALGLT